MNEIKEKILNTFKDYTFVDSTHTYYYKNKKVGISTTGLIHQYSQEFDKWGMSANVAIKRGISQLEVLEEWRKENLHSTIKGSMIHEFAQSLWEGKDYTFNYDNLPDEIDKKRLQEELLNMSIQAQKFYDDYKDMYVLIGCEIYLGVPDFDECGATDMLLQNKFTEDLLVVDFKSNKKIDYESFGHKKMKAPLLKYEDCNYVHYSLQLNAYAYKIEYMTGIKVKDKLLIYFDCNKQNYEVIEPLEMKEEIIKIYENRRVKNMNSVPVLLIGKSGSGKSASMRNFKKEEIAIINVLGKPLPFKNDLNAPKIDDYQVILNSIEKTDKKTIVIDDANYLITSEFMAKSRIKGYDKYNELADNFWNLIQGIKNIEGSKTVYLIMHEDTDEDGNVKPKTIGKLLDDKVNIQGMFTVCLRSMYENGNYIFRLKTNGQDCVKTPIGMFDTDEMENDLKKVDEIIRDYYDLDKKESEDKK